MIPIMGYRAMSIRRVYDDTFMLFGGFGAKWTSATMAAKCRNYVDSDDPVDRLIKHLNASEKEHSYNCRCGINAFWSFSNTKNIISLPHAIVVARAWGTVQLNSKGWRSSHAKMEHIYLPPELAYRKSQLKITYPDVSISVQEIKGLPSFRPTKKQLEDLV